MPYRWSDTPPQGARAHLTLWPHRSMPLPGFAAIIGFASVMMLIPLAPTLGTPVFWGLLPFMAAAIAALYVMIQRNYRDGEVSEELTLGGDSIHLHRRNPRGPDQSWQANPYWVQLTMHPERGRLKNYITLTGSAREVELGAFLTPEEREALYEELDRLLHPARV